jgi:hypothetical protein
VCCWLWAAACLSKIFNHGNRGSARKKAADGGVVHGLARIFTDLNGDADGCGAGLECCVGYRRISTTEIIFTTEGIVTGGIFPRGMVGTLGWMCVLGGSAVVQPWCDLGGRNVVLEPGGAGWNSTIDTSSERISSRGLVRFSRFEPGWAVRSRRRLLTM